MCGCCHRDNPKCLICHHSVMDTIERPGRGYFRKISPDCFDEDEIRKIVREELQKAIREAFDLG